MDWKTAIASDRRVRKSVHKSLRETFGQNVRAARASRKLSQEAFADLCGLDRSYLGGVERGDRNVSIDNIEKIAKALDRRASTLLD